MNIEAPTMMPMTMDVAWTSVIERRKAGGMRG